VAIAPISFAEGSASNEVKRAGQTDGEQSLLLANGMPVRTGSATNILMEKAFRDHLFERIISGYSRLNPRAA
jgi:hypothetical protein